MIYQWLKVDIYEVFLFAGANLRLSKPSEFIPGEFSTQPSW
jgi:hypothetical protein